MAAAVTQERVLYLLDPIGASRRSVVLRVGDFLLGLGRGLWLKDYAFELPWTPGFLHKHDGLVLSIGQFNQWVASQLMSSGLVQIWPGTPVKGPLFANRTVIGLRLVRPGRGQERHSRRRLHAGYGCACASDCGRRRPGGIGGKSDRRTAWHARRPRPARLGAGHEVRHRVARMSRIPMGWTKDRWPKTA